MKLRAKLLGYTAAIALSAGVAFAAVDGNAIAEQYLADGYSYVEVKVGPTQTKIEAIKDGVKTETIIDNETGLVLKSETEAADEEELAQTGSEVETVDSDFTDGEDGDDEEEDDEDDSDDSDESDESDDSDDSDDDGESDDSGSDGEGDDDGDSSGSDGEGDGDGDSSGSDGEGDDD